MDETEFRILETEYKQASLLYQHGIENFLGIVKTFIYSNIFMMLILYAWLKLGPHNARLFVLYVALLGIVACLSMFTFHQRTTICVHGWLERASELEAQFGGQVFTRTLEIEKQSRNHVVQLNFILLILYVLFALGWASIIYVALVE